MTPNWKLALAIVVALSMTQAAAAQGRGNGKAAGPDRGKASKIEAGENEDRGRSAQRRVVIDRDGDRRVIDDYFRQQSLPPGLAKRQSLPPGLAKQLQERGELPPGLQKRLVNVPASLNSRLQPLPVSYHRYFAGNDLIVVDSPANRIVAIMRNVLR